MTSRERVRLAMEHREADWVPIDFGGMRSTGISAIAYNNLRKYLNITDGENRIYDIFQQLAEPEEKLLRIMAGDVLQLHRYEPAFGINLQSWKDWTLPDGSACKVPGGFDPVKREDGSLDLVEDGRVIARMPAGGLYFDCVYHPYENARTESDIDAISEPEITEVELDYLCREAKRLHDETDYAILASFGGNIMEAGQAEWGYEKFYMALVLQPDLIQYYLNRKTDRYLRDLEKYMDAVGEYIDIIQFGDDLGTQESSQVSPQLYRDMIKPHHAKQYRWVRNNYPEVKVFMHNCGSIRNLIPDLIDAGVEILNPVQISAMNMDPLELKREFGKNLTFWGGGVDTQTTVTNGSVEEIRKSVKELINIFGPGGGFVFTQIHNIQANVSPEKIMAVYDTAKEVGSYPLGG